jgi:hypothetical protein
MFDGVAMLHKAALLRVDQFVFVEVLHGPGREDGLQAFVGAGL